MVIGSQALPAPQATLMATIIKGLLSQNLPWGLVLVGVFISITLELCGIHSLSFAVGSYLPIATTAPIFAGGLVRWFVERKTGVAEESEVGSGTLFSSGPDRRRLAGGHPVRGALRAEHHQGRRRCRHAGLIPVAARGHGRAWSRAALLFVALGVDSRRARRRRSWRKARSACQCAVLRVGGRCSSRCSLALRAAVHRTLSRDAHAPTDAPEALVAAPVFFHGKQIVVRRDVRAGRARSDAAGATRPSRSSCSGASHRRVPRDGEVRGEFWDLGRLRADDSRFSAIDFQPMLEPRATASGRRAIRCS